MAVKTMVLFIKRITNIRRLLVRSGDKWRLHVIKKRLEINKWFLYV